MRYLLLGGGDLVREVAKLLVDTAGNASQPCEIAVFSDRANALVPESAESCSTPVEALRRFPPSEWQAIGCLGEPKMREAMYAQFRNMGYVFAKVCHRDATVFAEQIGAGCVVFPGARLAIGCRLAEDVLVNFNATVGHDTVIGAHSVISPGVQLGGRISCGERVTFGIGASVLQRRRIGDDSVVSAGAAVWTNVPENVTMVGVPAVSRKVPGRSSGATSSKRGEGNQKQ